MGSGEGRLSLHCKLGSTSSGKKDSGSQDNGPVNAGHIGVGGMYSALDKGRAKPVRQHDPVPQLAQEVAFLQRCSS